MLKGRYEERGAASNCTVCKHGCNPLYMALNFKPIYISCGSVEGMKFMYISTILFKFKLMNLPFWDV